VNEVTKKAFEAIKKATKDSCSGVISGAPFRLLWEPTDKNNNYKEFGELFNRNELEQGYLTESVKLESRAFDLMTNQAQNDIVAPIHRDLCSRYSGRIHRILEEVARRECIALEKVGVVSLMENTLEAFLASTELKG
jgi:hypothetical protein